MRRLASTGLAAACAFIAHATSAPAATFDYLYVEANEGGSSGGHAAIRFADRTYHFQNRDGLLVLDRETTRDFLRAYALLGNRTIELRRIDVAEADRTRLQEQFERRLRAQRRQLDVLAALREDRALLRAWQDDEPEPGVPGLGYFESAGPPAASVVRVRARVLARHGGRFLERRREQLNALLRRAAADDPTASPVELPTDSYDEPAFRSSFARRYHGLRAGLAALHVLENGEGLSAEATIRPRGPRWWLGPRELSRLDVQARALEDALLRLVASEREDWGRPFLVGLARLLALEESRRSGRLVFLDAVPDDARPLDRDILEARREEVEQMLLAGHEQVERARLAWVRSESPGEREWVRVEDAANRVHELDSSARESRDLRVARGAWVPSRPAPLPGGAPPAVSRERIRGALARVEAREAEYFEALEGLYRYRLLTRNCVSELFHTLNDGFDGSVSRSEDALGGHIDGHSGFSFVPFASAAAVDREYRVRERRTLPSFRELRIEEMKRSENPLLVALRESNTLTARSYGRGHRDSWFLFFTEEPLPLRPVFGVFNLLAGLGESAWGLAQLPFDRGDALVSGINGTLASLPELVFWNIRKGSNDWVPKEAAAAD